MRLHGLLTPVRGAHAGGDRSHSGRIRTERPDELRGTDASRFSTKAEGWYWFFVAVDHCTSDVVVGHVAKKGYRRVALEPVRQGVRAHKGGASARRSPIHLHNSGTLKEARAVIGTVIERYNNGWLLQRRAYMTLARAREKFSRRAA